MCLQVWWRDYLPNLTENGKQDPAGRLPSREEEDRTAPSAGDDRADCSGRRERKPEVALPRAVLRYGTTMDHSEVLFDLDSVETCAQHHDKAKQMRAAGSTFIQLCVQKW